MKTVNELLLQETVTDAEITGCAYGIEYFTFDGIPTDVEIERMRNMRLRLREIEAMKKAAMKARVAGQKNVRAKLADCGHFTIEVMSASRGTSCPDCYDRMSD